MSWTHELDAPTATTPPSAVYTDPAALDLQIDRVLARAWHPVPTPPGPHHVVPVDPLDGLARLPALITHDKRSGLHAISNVCTHRGAILVTETCKTRTIRCPYHARCFKLDGQLSAAPGFEDAPSFPRDTDNLPKLSLETLGPIAFLAHEPAIPFGPWLEALRDRCGYLPWESLVYDETGEEDYEVAAHWQLYVDNYLEGFHIPYVHPGLNQALDASDYAIECHPWSTLQVGIAANPSDAFPAAPEGHPDHGQAVAAYYWWLCPNLMLNLYPWGVSMNIVIPRDTRHSVVRYRRWIWDPSRLQTGAGSDLDTVEREDHLVVERCGRGVRSRLYDRGRYSGAHERGVHHAHGLLNRLLRQP